MPDVAPNPSGRDALAAQFIDVHKSYDGRTSVLSHFNLDVLPGEFLTLLGASGSGKTTCLMLLAGFEEATGGTILLNGQPANDVPPWRRNIGVVFQNYAIFPHMTVQENIAYPLKIRKWTPSEIDKRTKSTLEMVRLTQFGSRKPSQLSGGQQQRVALGRALVFDPQLILMDEPLGALDRQLREEMQYEIKRLRADIKASIVYVTHDQTEALVLSDRTAVMSGGRIEQIGAPVELYDRPANAFVARFFGENNSFKATVVSTDGLQCRARIASGEIFAGTTAEPLEAGTAADVFVRPERIQLLQEGGAGADNTAAVDIVESTYHGEYWRVRGRIGTELVVLKLPPRSNETSNVESGSQIRVGWSIRECRVLRRASGDKP